jgi:hypothetical protein
MFLRKRFIYFVLECGEDRDVENRKNTHIEFNDSSINQGDLHKLKTLRYSAQYNQQLEIMTQ